MNILNKVGLCLLAIVLTISCVDLEDNFTSNAIYLKEAAEIESVKLAIDDQGGKMNITPIAGNILSADEIVRLKVDPMLLDGFNEKFGSDYKILPSDFYTLSTTESVLKKGKISADLPVVLNVKPFNEALDPTVKYALPITIDSVEGDVEVLESSRTVFVLLDKVIITSVVKSNGPVYADEISKPFKDLAEWSFEFSVKVDRIDIVNQVLMMGYPTEVYSRFGDVVIKPNQLQVKTGGGQPYASKEFAANTWYTFAYVYDGSRFKIYVDGEMILNVDAPKPNLLYEFKWLGFGNNNFSGQVREVRIWNKALSENFIKNNLYIVSPKSEGLLLYYRMDEGEGDILHDLSASNENMKLQPGCSWVEGVRFPNK